jgi:NADP-dependent 3-hydroxy acid dehydrogenase YdfG
MSGKVIAVLGVGPGLGMSMAHRFGREGFAVALVSRSDARHALYRAELAAEGVEVRTYVADVTDDQHVRRVLEQIRTDLGAIDTVYFGPASMDSARPVPLAEADAAAVRGPVGSVLLPAVGVVAAVLPAMRSRGGGALFFGGGLSGKYPMPMLGSLAPASAALRMYVLTLNAAVAEEGVYVAVLTIGGLIERGDIHRAFREYAHSTLDPDEIADTAWDMYVTRDRAEAEFVALPAAAS